MADDTEKPEREPYTEKRIRAVLEERRAAGDAVAGDLAAMLLKAQKLCERADDTVASFAREVRRVVPAEVLAAPEAVAVRAILAEVLDGERPAAVEAQDGPILQVRNLHWAALQHAESLMRTLGDAENFAQMAVVVPDGTFTLVIRRPGGRTPMEVVRELQAALEVAEVCVQGEAEARRALEDEVERLRSELVKYQAIDS